MKRFLCFCISWIAAVAAAHAQPSIQFLYPTNGETVTSPLYLRVTLAPSIHPVVSVEYFANGQSIGVVSNQWIVPIFPPPPILLTNPITIIPTNPIAINPIVLTNPMAIILTNPAVPPIVPPVEDPPGAGIVISRNPLPPTISLPVEIPPTPPQMTPQFLKPRFPRPRPVGPIVPVPPLPPPLPIPLPPPIIYWPFMLYWNPAPGDYVLTAQATDDQGNTSMSDPVDVTVIPTPVVTVQATQPISSPGNPGEFTISRTGDTSTDLGVWIFLSGNAENGVDYASVSNVVTIPAGSAAVDVPIEGLKFSPNKSKMVTLGLVGYAIPLNLPATEGIWPVLVPFNMPYQVGTPNNATVYIKANPRNQHAPSVALLLPYNGLTAPAGTSIEIIARAMDADTYVTTVDFFDGTTQIGEVTNATPTIPGQPMTFQLLWTNAPLGNHLLRARATDSQGATQVSAPVRMQVVPKR